MHDFILVFHDCDSTKKILNQNIFFMWPYWAQEPKRLIQGHHNLAFRYSQIYMREENKIFKI